MDTSINFYELKTQLADIGFHEPAIVDQLREAMYTEYNYASLYTEKENTRFQINLDKDYTGAFSFDTYDAILTSGDQLRDQVFSPNVPVSEAIQLLHGRLQRPDVTADIAGSPMNRQETRVSLGLSPNDHNEPLKQINNPDEQFVHKSQNPMNTQNVEFLKKALLNLGFGEQVNAALEKQIKAKTPEFTLAAKHEFNQQKVDHTLHFKAGENQEMYFFNKFDTTLDKGKEKEQNQTFYINKGNGITAKEAFNLMEGRAVHKQLFNKEGEGYHAWLQLDDKNLTQNGNKEIKRFNENYGFDLESVLKDKGIKELNTPEGTDNLFRSLKKGNAQQVTIERNGEEKKYFISASPQYKTIDLYDHQMKKIKREELLQPEQKQSTSQRQSNNQKQGKQQKEELPGKKQSRKSKLSV
ncbi:hypothetical protein [Mucilaginibacter sp.]|uniref:hypothetical protein n=1 Tax=Mucilaginibacter sp. TaxID=1882438 RepID=UPI003D13DAF3